MPLSHRCYNVHLNGAGPVSAIEVWSKAQNFLFPPFARRSRFALRRLTVFNHFENRILRTNYSPFFFFLYLFLLLSSFFLFSLYVLFHFPDPWPSTKLNNELFLMVKWISIHLKFQCKSVGINLDQSSGIWLLINFWNLKKSIHTRALNIWGLF